MTTECMVEGYDAKGNIQCLMVKVIKERPSLSSLRRALTTALISAVLLFSATVALLIAVSVALPASLGLKSMVVVSGSMEPTINLGDVVMIRPLPSESVQVGDLITFRALGTSGMTTHRVVATKEIDGYTYFQTKGDANDSADPNLAPAEGVVGKVVWTEPKVGYLLAFGATIWGKLLMIILPLLLVLALEARDLLRPRKQREPQNGLGRLGGHHGASLP